MKAEGLISLVKDRNTQDIRGQEIRRELNTLELGSDGSGEGLGQSGFAGPRIVLQEDMAPAGKGS